MTTTIKRLDHRIIYSIIEQRAKVLDLGCGEGDLLRHLADEKECRVQGIELDEKAIYKCVEKGLSVFHSDIDSGLIEYPDKSFDYVILNQSMQQVKRAEFVVREGLRVGAKLIVGFPNFAHLPARLKLFFMGKAPVTSALPYRWYNSPNVRFFSISDFKEFCSINNITILEEHYLTTDSEITVWPNLLAQDAIFVVKGLQ